MTEGRALDHVRLSRSVSHALRHEPWLYELELDEEGWVPVDALLTALRRQAPEWSRLSRDDLTAMVASSTKRRHELDGGRVRALYGHSLPGKLLRQEGVPPRRLFHGTSRAAWEQIRTDGLRPMQRQYVHLSTDVATARQVGLRKDTRPVVLTVDARRASDAGTRFWRGNEMVWLADHVPPSVIEEEHD